MIRSIYRSTGLGGNLSVANENAERRAREAATALRRAVAGMELACAGTIYVRKRKCGKTACRCHEDPAALHGPYSEWTRLRGGRLAHSLLSAEQAERLTGAIANYREIRRSSSDGSSRRRRRSSAWRSGNVDPTRSYDDRANLEETAAPTCGMRARPAR